jgi:hypothetical protein
MDKQTLTNEVAALKDRISNRSEEIRRLVMCNEEDQQRIDICKLYLGEATTAIVYAVDEAFIDNVVAT